MSGRGEVTAAWQEVDPLHGVQQVISDYYLLSIHPLFDPLLQRCLMAALHLIKWTLTLVYVTLYRHLTG